MNESHLQIAIQCLANIIYLIRSRHLQQLILIDTSSREITSAGGIKAKESHPRIRIYDDFAPVKIYQLAQTLPNSKKGVSKDPLVMISRYDYRRLAGQQLELMSKVPVLLSMASSRLVKEIAGNYNLVHRRKVGHQGCLYVYLCICCAISAKMEIAQVQQTTRRRACYVSRR